MHSNVAINHDFPVLHAPAYAPNLAGVAVEGYVWSFCCRGFLDFEEVVEFLLFVAFPDVKCGYLSHGFALKNVWVDAFSDYWKLELPEGGQCYHFTHPPLWLSGQKLSRSDRKPDSFLIQRSSPP